MWQFTHVEMVDLGSPLNRWGCVAELGHPRYVFKDVTMRRGKAALLPETNRVVRLRANCVRHLITQKHVRPITLTMQGSEHERCDHAVRFAGPPAEPGSQVQK